MPQTNHPPVDANWAKRFADDKRAENLRLFEDVSYTLTFEFDSPVDALAFKRWLCRRGEQEFWNYEDPEFDDREHAIVFDYHAGSTIRASRL